MVSKFDSMFLAPRMQEAPAAICRPPEEMHNFHLIVALCVAALVLAPILFGWTAMMWL